MTVRGHNFGQTSGAAKLGSSQIYPFQVATPGPQSLGQTKLVQLPTEGEVERLQAGTQRVREIS